MSYENSSEVKSEYDVFIYAVSNSSGDGMTSSIWVCPPSNKPDLPLEEDPQATCVFGPAYKKEIDSVCENLIRVFEKLKMRVCVLPHAD